MLEPKVRFAIHVPLAANDGERLDNVHADVRARLITTFGAYSETACGGSWLGDDGREYSDAQRIYHVDTDPSIVCERAIITIAREVAQAGRQECVYVTRQPINTTLVAAEE